MSFRKNAVMVAMVLALPLAACDVDQTEEGDMPEVEIEGGNLPEYDVDGPDVDVGRDTIVVPDVDVTIPNDGNGTD